MSAEDAERQRGPGPSRSPAGSTKGDGASGAAAEEDEELVKDRPQQSRPRPPQPSTGPASEAARGSSASIPFIDCSDVDSESDLLREHASRSQTNDNYEADVTSGVYLPSRDDRRIEARPRAAPHPAKSSRPPSREFLDDDSGDLSFDLSGSPRLPRHSSLIDEMFRGSGHSPLATPLSPSSRSSSPSLSWDRTGSQGYVSENTHDRRERSVGGESFPSQEPHYENGSPSSQRPYLRNLRYNKSETDPLILSKVASTPEAMDMPDGFGKGGLAGLGGGMLANGTPLMGPTSRMVRSVGTAGKAPLQMTEGSTSSGSESSDSDSEMVNPLSRPLVFGNPAVLSSPSRVRTKKSLGGLPLNQEIEEDE